MTARCFALFVSVAGCVVATGCGPVSDSTAATAVAPAHEGAAGQYYVRGVRDDVAGDLRLLVNGFPVWKGYGFAARSRPGAGIKADATPALVSGANVAAVEVTPFVRRSGGAVEAGPVRLRLWVEAPDGSRVPGTEAASDSAFAAFEAGLESRWPRWLAAEDSLLRARPSLAAALADSAARDPRASAYGAGPALDSARAWAAARPVVVETAWVRPGGASDGQPSFDAVFRDAAVIGGTAADSARLRAYAVRLGGLLAAAGTDPAAAEAFYDELGPAVSDSTGWYSVAADGTRPSALAAIRDEWAADFQGGFGPADVGLRSWSGGRVWEVYRTDGVAQRYGSDALLLFGGERIASAVGVYVGEPGGRLRVVRVE